MSNSVMGCKFSISAHVQFLKAEAPAAFKIISARRLFDYDNVTTGFHDKMLFFLKS